MSNSLLAYTPKEIYEEIEVITQAGLMPMITASPGVGKSSIVSKFAKDYGLLMIDVRLGQTLPEDLNGLPVRMGDKAAFLPFDNFPLEGDQIPKGFQGWCIFFDEITSAQKATQAAAYKVILDRLIGNRKLHHNVVMVAAGNKSTDRAVVNVMSTALQSRMIHLELEPSVVDFTEWGVQVGLDQRVLAYVNEMPSRLMVFDPTKAGLEKNFQCPRTYEFLSRLIKGREIVPKNLGRIAGTIGEGGATEFMSFCQLYDKLPKVADIIANPGAVSVPAEASTKYATTFMLVEHMQDQNVVPIITYMKKFGLDQQIVFSRATHAKNPVLLEKNPDFAGYMQDMLKYMAA